MGADGGLNWMTLKDPSKLQRIYDLLCPLGFIACNWRVEDYEYIEKHKPFDGSKSVISKYGTEMSHSGMEDLRDLLQETNARDYEKTFEEVCFDLATRQDYEMFELSLLETAVLKTVSNSDFEIYCDNWYGKRTFNSQFNNQLNQGKERPNRIAAGISSLGELKDMKVSDWIKELKTNLDWKHCCSVETWT